MSTSRKNDLSLGGVTMGSSGTLVAVSVSTSGNYVDLFFTIPQGESGGVTSTDVTNAIANEISGTARNPNSVSMLGIVVGGPQTQAELQAVVDKVIERINALRR